MNITISPKNCLHGTLSVPGDKSISHRAVMLGAIAHGTTTIHGFLMGEDCLSTISCFRKLGIEIEISNHTQVIVHGKGLHGLKEPSEPLDVGNSGTTLRLLSGLLAAQPFSTTLTGDASIQKRPMDRVALPLKEMNAVFEHTQEKVFAPFTIHGNALKGIHYTLPVASAQVKSAILLAGLYAEGETLVTEPEATRNHTEIMLNYLGASITTKGNTIHCPQIKELYAKPISVPGDISSAAYFIVAGCICPNSELIISDVGINPTRTGIIDALIAMGANIQIDNKREKCGEKVGDIHVQASPLHGSTISGADIPRLIDEIPILAVAACFAEGTTIIKDAQELKVKESNRIQTVVTELKKLGANIEETEDGMVIHGGHSLQGTTIESYQDHRIAMSMAIAGLCASGTTTIQNGECVDISFPGFYSLLDTL